MKYLLDTHVLLWAAGEPERLSAKTRKLLSDEGNALLFSPVSLWEIVIKQDLGRQDFRANARELRRSLLDNGYNELPVEGVHALALEDLPALHKDPFDRMLLAQARAEGVTLLTTDSQVLRYGGSVQKA